jgi:threonine dehydrogenase-like Zn-dependent dehydrogenase
MSVAMDLRAQRQNARKEQSNLVFGSAIMGLCLVGVASVVTFVVMNQSNAPAIEAKANGEQDHEYAKAVSARGKQPVDEREMKRRAAMAMDASCTFSISPATCREAVNRMRAFDNMEMDLKEESD